MKIKRSFLILLFIIIEASYSLIISQINIEDITEIFQVEYGCITGSQTYEIDFVAFEATNLANNVTYYLDLENNPSVFNTIDYESKSGNWTEIYSNQWKWEHTSLTTDTVILEGSGDYEDIELGSFQWFKFGASAPYHGSDIDYVKIEIVTSMIISGPSLVCNNPATFYLLDMPSNYTSATWEIKQNGSQRASGSGTTAYASNLSYGSGQVNFTIEFSCGLEDVTLSKDFWFGKPYVDPETIEFDCAEGSGYLCTNAFGNEFSFEYGGIFDHFDIKLMNLSETQTIDEFTIYDTWGTIDCTPDEGTYKFMVRGNNTCGDASNWSKTTVEYVDCGMELLIFPNPTQNESKIQIVTPNKEVILDYNDRWSIEVFTQDNTLKFKDLNIIGDNYILNTSSWQTGLYNVFAYYRDKVISGTLVITK